MLFRKLSLAVMTYRWKLWMHQCLQLGGCRVWWLWPTVEGYWCACVCNPEGYVKEVICKWLRLSSGGGYCVARADDLLSYENWGLFAVVAIRQLAWSWWLGCFGKPGYIRPVIWRLAGERERDQTPLRHWSTPYHHKMPQKKTQQEKYHDRRCCNTG